MGIEMRWVLALAAAIAGLALVIALVASRRQSPERALEQASDSYRRGEWGQAADLARLVLKTRPSETSALRILARSSARTGNDAAAEAIYRRLGTGAMSAEDFFLLANGLLKRDPHGPGLAALGAAHDLDPDHPETLNAVLGLLIDGQALLQAAADAHRLRGRPGWEIRGTLVLAQVRQMLLEPAAAAELLLDVLNRDPSLAGGQMDPRDARMLLARCLLD